MTFTVTKTGSTTLATSVGYSFADGTAKTTGTADLLDYAATAGTLNFAAGDTSKTITVTINNDSVFEGSENFNVNLASATNATISDNQGVGTIKDDGTGDSTHGGSGTGTNDDRALSVNSITVNEASPYAVFSITANSGQTLNLALSNGTVNPTATSGTDYGASLEYWNGTAWTAYSAGFTVPGTGTGSSTLLVRMAITQDTSFEKAEDYKLTATYTSGASRTATGTATIVDDGTGTKYPDQSPGAGPAPITETTSLDDDRSITVSGLDDVSEGSNSIFTVTLPEGNTHNTEISLALTNGTAGTADYNITFTAYYYNGATQVALPVIGGKITLPAGVSSFYVSVPTTQDPSLEGAENFSLSAAINGGKSANDTSSILDDGTGKIYDAKGLNPTGPGNDDRPVPPAAPAPLLAVPVAPVAVMLPYAEVRISTPEIPNLTPPPAKTITELPTLTVASKVPDQYADSGAKSSFAVPKGAFVHTDPTETLKLSAALADGTKLPNWIRFDANSGNFVFEAPQGFLGELRLKVIARDSKGNEVSTIFRFNVGKKNEAVTTPKGRISLSEQIRLANRDRGFTFLRDHGRMAASSDDHRVGTI